MCASVCVCVHLSVYVFARARACARALYVLYDPYIKGYYVECYFSSCKTSMLVKGNKRNMNTVGGINHLITLPLRNPSIYVEYIIDVF